MLLPTALLTKAQYYPCPPNLDFQEGSFNNWVCETGKYDPVRGSIRWDFPAEQNPVRHVIIHPANSANDDYAPIPRKCPNGSGYSILLGDKWIRSGAECERISYEFTVPNDGKDFMFVYWYAVVLADFGHAPGSEPRFKAAFTDLSTGLPICGSALYNKTTMAGMPGFQTSGGVYYNDWTNVSVDLTEYKGKSVRVEFTTFDCGDGSGGFGYAYIDIDQNCSAGLQGATVCNNAPSITLKAPGGYKDYVWYQNQSYINIISTSETAFLVPPPPAGTILPVITTPFPIYGCPNDTFYAKVKYENNPVADAGPDKSVCQGKGAVLGTEPKPNHIYIWSPITFLSDVNEAEPSVSPTLSVPATYYLQVILDSTGCTAYDTVTVTPVDLDEFMTVAGDTIYCKGINNNTLLTTYQPGAQIQWYGNGSPVPGANGVQFSPQPSVTTRYWATITKGGCTEETRDVTVRIEPVPKASFDADAPAQCINIPAYFTNTSTVNSTDPLTYIWQLHDGTFKTDKDISITYPGTGNFPLQLKAISAFGCRDSTSMMVKVIDYCGVFVPNAFTPNNDGMNDAFTPVFRGVKGKNYRFSVYSRDGFRIFTSTKIGEGWDGKRKGIHLTTSMYVWMVEYIDVYGKQVLLKGTVALIK